MMSKAAQMMSEAVRMMSEAGCMQVTGTAPMYASGG